MVTVESVFRHPVKSMAAVSMGSAVVDASGVAGDRAWALRDVATGKIASAKQPRLWRKLLLIRVEVSADGPDFRMVLPDGTRLAPGDASTDEALSRYLGRSVELLSARESSAEIDRAVPEEVLDAGPDAEVDATQLQLAEQTPGQTFMDFAPLHIVTTATLTAISKATGKPVDARVLRPNLVLSTPGEAGFIENDWVGREIDIGSNLRLEVFLPTPRCAIPTLTHASSAADPDILRSVSRLNRIPVEGFGTLPSAGVYAKVSSAGSVRAGDRVTLL